MDTRLFAFVGADIGPWRIVRAETRVGEPLPEAKRLNVVSASELQSETNAPWILRGITSNERYVMRAEKNEIVAKQQGLARPEATCGALIPIRKNAAWWELTQDERRSVFEQSKHVQIGLQYLPAVARKLHHCRDLSENERHCCKVSDEAAFCLIQRPYISKTLLTRRISPRGSP